MSIFAKLFIARRIIIYNCTYSFSVQLNNDKLNKIANHIITLFPAECKEVYYCPPVKKKDSKNHKSGIARGKLVDKNRNMLAFLRKCQLIRSSSEKVQDKDSLNEDFITFLFVANTDNGEDEVEQRESHNWLRNNFEPWEEVLYHWEKSFVFRKNLIHDHTTYRNLVSIFDDWNILTSSKGYVLVNNCSIYVLCTYIYIYIYIYIYLLFSLLPNKSPKAKVGKNIFKPTLVESQEAVVLHVKIPGDVEEEIKKKRNWLQKFRLTLQPFIVVVGPSITEIQSIFVRIDDVSYKVKTVFKALEICFMSFVVLDLKYPPAAEHIWYLLQRTVFDLEFQGDNKIPMICDVIKKISK
ncbi:hypothetical protein ALC57_14062 [Trachymyrmex cornetzi]|uniref:Uncharacterized protein n=1 Tax=Trachymyrmex cornetzi TaxID=471704 RepID=A0A151IYV9_9HYME|nr:hypothetical protein ALC57_14062 [Trachymyrmex cornetzi]